MKTNKHFTAFAGTMKIATGELDAVLTVTKAYRETHNTQMVLIFDDETGRDVDFDLTGTVDEMLKRAHKQLNRMGTDASADVSKKPGRPKLGVTSREVTLLPRHWEWLDRQPLGASGTLRRLVETAIKSETDFAGSPQRIEAAGRFLWTIAGNFENFEEATRALYAKNWDALRDLTTQWPKDITDHMNLLIFG